ncbi:MAG: acireductone synthase [Rhizobiales bacterium]|nr:acireductone synthase [Hyphomicrobiales bacterium]
MSRPVKAIVTDIEGTTTPISFVHDVLFPYARERLADFCATHATSREVADVLMAARALDGHSTLDLPATIDLLKIWMAEDRKAGPLKTLQGMIWRQGYVDGVLKGQVYADAAEMLRAWHERGLSLYVYSSGSIAAQKLIYGYSDQGDLTPLFKGYFDTGTGAKLESASYRKIAETTGFAPGEMLFLSDHRGEIDAALEAGMQAICIDRSMSLEDTRNDGACLTAGSLLPVDAILRGD